MPPRRVVLAIVGGALASGCLTRIRCAYVFRLEATPAAEIALSIRTPPEEHRETIDEALPDGSVSAVSMPGTGFRDGDVLEHDGTFYEITVEGASDDPGLPRYAFERLGSTLSAVREHVIPDDPPSIDDLPPEALAVVDEAIDGRYEACEEVPPGLQTLEDHLGPRDRSPPDRQDWYVTYEGEVYGLLLTSTEF